VAHAVGAILRLGLMGWGVVNPHFIGLCLNSTLARQSPCTLPKGRHMKDLIVPNGLPQDATYFMCLPKPDGTVTVGVEDSRHSKYLWVRRGLPLEPETYFSAEAMYDCLCAMGYRLCWCGTKWF